MLAWWKATADLLIEEGEIIPTGRWDHTVQKAADAVV
jgi:hypothetical protein